MELGSEAFASPTYTTPAPAPATPATPGAAAAAVATAAAAGRPSHTTFTPVQSSSAAAAGVPSGSLDSAEMAEVAAGRVVVSGPRGPDSAFAGAHAAGGIGAVDDDVAEVGGRARLALVAAARSIASSSSLVCSTHLLQDHRPLYSTTPVAPHHTHDDVITSPAAATATAVPGAGGGGGGAAVTVSALSKYVRDIGLRARSLVGGALGMPAGDTARESPYLAPIQAPI